jgi:PIN domain nuclease of toxin-antitoxin system
MKNYLLDTCSLLWLLQDNPRLSALARRIIMSKDSNIHVSAVSFVEISIKSSIGKLSLDDIDYEQLPATLYEGGTTLIPLEPFESIALRTLSVEGRHSDPFDRMLVCQAIERGLTLISPDKDIAAYREDGLSLVWE